MSILQIDSWKKVLIHIGIMLGITALIIYGVLYVYLPGYTNHGQEIEVPVLDNLSVQEAQEILNDKNLRLEIQDTTYNSRFKPNRVTRQEPPAGSNVKQERRIYVSVNTSNVPTIKVTEKMYAQFKNKGLDIIKSKIIENGFDVGNKIYECGPYPDYVIGVMCKGDTLRPGVQLPIHSKIDLIIWDGRCK